MAKAKLHHFVPQFYLRQWCDSAGKLWVYPVDGTEPFRASPKQFAAETHLYKPKAGAEAVRDDTEIWMSGWEGRFAKVWPDIVDRSDDPKTRANVARFIGTLIARHPTSQAYIRELNLLFRQATIGLGDDEEVTFLNKGGEVRINVADTRELALTDPDSVRTDFIRLMPHVSKVPRKR